MLVGGNTFRLLDRVRTHGFIDAVRAFVADGGAYYGGSAGAILASDSIRIAEDYDTNDIGLTDLSAVGLVRNLDVLPHFTPGQHAAMVAWAASSHDTSVLAIPNASGVVVDDGKIRVLGPTRAPGHCDRHPCIRSHSGGHRRSDTGRRHAACELTHAPGSRSPPSRFW